MGGVVGGGGSRRSRSLGVLDGSRAEVSHFGVFHLLLVQLVLGPQEQLEEFRQFGGRLPIFIVQHRLVHLAPHLRGVQRRGAGLPKR